MIINMDATWLHSILIHYSFLDKYVRSRIELKFCDIRTLYRYYYVQQLRTRSVPTCGKKILSEIFSNRRTTNRRYIHSDHLPSLRPIEQSTMTRFNSILAIIATLAATTGPFAQAAFSKEATAEIFKTFDVDEDEAPDCREDDGFDEQVCPDDEKICCQEISDIHAHCERLLGPLAAGDSPKETGTNALEGCIRYVGYHVFDNNHMACCPSEHCEDWIDEQFDSMGDDDDDDDYDQGDYDQVEDDDDEF